MPNTAYAKLARLPIPRGEPWRIGHFARPLPAGYHRTLATGVDHLRDPDLAAYFELLERVTRGEAELDPPVQ